MVMAPLSFITNLIINGTTEDQNFRVAQHTGHLLISNVLGEHNTADHFTVALASSRNLLELDILTNIHTIVFTNIRGYLMFGKGREDEEATKKIRK